MPSTFRTILALTALLLSATPALWASGFDPRDYQGKVAGPPTQILVLGTTHLNATPEEWDPKLLGPLLDKLAAFRPDIIAVEALSGQSLSKLWAYRPVYDKVAVSYGARLMMLSAAGSVGTGLDVAEAEAEARRQLLAWPPAPAPAQRRRLAALMAAAGDAYSALVQWWRLDPAERRPGDGINTTLKAQLEDFAKRRDESHLVGSALAVRLGLEQVHPIDAQDDDTLTSAQMDQFAKEVFPRMSEAYGADPRGKRIHESASRLDSPEATLAVYRALNAPETGKAYTDLEWLAVIDRPTPDSVGRIRTAGWEVRNLRMAANIREAAGRVPGGRVLVIVGAAHKPWLDAYLSMMTDVKIVDAMSVLGR